MPLILPLRLCLIIIFFGLLGCSSRPSIKPDDLIIPDLYPSSRPAELTPEQVRRDIDTLIYGFTNGYGGRKYIDPKQMKQVQVTLENLRSASQNVPVRLLCEKIDDAFSSISDNHLTAKRNGQTCSSHRNEPTGSVGPNIGANAKKTLGH